MNSLEDRLRAGLESPLSADPADTMLDRVHRGAQRRRRRTSAIVAASVVAVAGVAVGLSTLDDDSGKVQPLPPSSSTPSLPAGATVGAIDVAVPDADHVFKLTVNEGCVACSTIWLLGPDGTWERLHDFSGREAYSGRVDPLFGPIEYVDFAPDARNGWAWGKTLFSTHDGGRTWREVTDGPGARTDYGHWVWIRDDKAFSLFRGEAGEYLYWTPVGRDDWQDWLLPGRPGVVDMFTTRDRVVVMTSSEGADQLHLLSTKDAPDDWTGLDLPCQGENQPYPAATEVFVLCGADKGGAMVYRTADMASWDLFGHSDLTAVTAVVPLADDRLLLLGQPHDLLVTPAGSEPIDVGLRRGEEVFQHTSGVAGDTAYVVTSEHRILVSRDAGLTWSELG